MVRVVSPQQIFIANAWSDIDKTVEELSPATATHPALGSIGGRSLVMVLSHDCQLDKETSRAARKIMKQNPQMTLEEAFEFAEDDDDLDRFAIVAPIVNIDKIPNRGDTNFTDSIINGTTVGYFTLHDEPSLAINRMTVDLSYRSTVDVLTLTDRYVSITDAARLQLRYTIAKMDTLRVPTLDANFREAVGQRIIDIQLADKASNIVKLVLEGGKILEVLLPAAPVDQSGPVRKKARSIGP